MPTFDGASESTGCSMSSDDVATATGRTVGGNNASRVASNRTEGTCVTDSNGDSTDPSCGVLLGNRVLESVKNALVRRHPGGGMKRVPHAMRLGTVVDYFPPSCLAAAETDDSLRSTAVADKRSDSENVDDETADRGHTGEYLVLFDGNQTPYAMTPDEVYERSILYHKQRRYRVRNYSAADGSSLEGRCRYVIGVEYTQHPNRGDRASLKGALLSLSEKKASLEGGEYEICRHANLPLTRRDIAMLDKERIGHWCENQLYFISSNVPCPTRLAEKPKGGIRNWRELRWATKLCEYIDSEIPCNEGEDIDDTGAVSKDGRCSQLAMEYSCCSSKQGMRFTTEISHENMPQTSVESGTRSLPSVGVSEEALHMSPMSAEDRGGILCETKRKGVSTKPGSLAEGEYQSSDTEDLPVGEDSECAHIPRTFSSSDSEVETDPDYDTDVSSSYPIAATDVEESSQDESVVAQENQCSDASINSRKRKRNEEPRVASSNVVGVGRKGRKGSEHDSVATSTSMNPAEQFPDHYRGREDDEENDSHDDTVLLQSSAEFGYNSPTSVTCFDSANDQKLPSTTDSSCESDQSWDENRSVQREAIEQKSMPVEESVETHLPCTPIEQGKDRMVESKHQNFDVSSKVSMKEPRALSSHYEFGPGSSRSQPHFHLILKSQSPLKGGSGGSMHFKSPAKKPSVKSPASPSLLSNSRDVIMEDNPQSNHLETFSKFMNSQYAYQNVCLKDNPLTSRQDILHFVQDIAKKHSLPENDLRARVDIMSSLDEGPCTTLPEPLTEKLHFCVCGAVGFPRVARSLHKEPEFVSFERGKIVEVVLGDLRGKRGVVKGQRSGQIAVSLIENGAPLERWFDAKNVRILSEIEVVSALAGVQATNEDHQSKLIRESEDEGFPQKDNPKKTALVSGVSRRASDDFFDSFVNDLFEEFSGNKGEQTSELDGDASDAAATVNKSEMSAQCSDVCDDSLRRPQAMCSPSEEDFLASLADSLGDGLSNPDEFFALLDKEGGMQLSAEAGTAIDSDCVERREIRASGGVTSTGTDSSQVDRSAPLRQRRRRPKIIPGKWGELGKLTVEELKERLREVKCRISGNKTDLLERLYIAYQGLDSEKQTSRLDEAKEGEDLDKKGSP